MSHQSDHSLLDFNVFDKLENDFLLKEKEKNKIEKCRLQDL